MTLSQDIVFFLCLNDRGGAEISMIRLAERLRRSGRGVSLAVYGAQPLLARELGFTGEVVDLKCRRTLAAIVPLIALLRLRRPTFLLSALTHTNLAALMASFFARTKVIVTEHGVDGVEACAASSFFARIVRFLYRRAVAVVAVSQGLADRWGSFLSPCTRVAAIYNPVVDKEQISAQPAHEWLSSKQMPVVIGMGRLKPEKNFALLIRAFALLQKTKPARLIILGEGPERAALEKLARDLGVADQVLLPGFVADTGAWLAYGDLLVCPSRREGFGNVIVEALACGMPVVATDCPYGPSEILQQGRYGHLVPMENADAMAAAMRAALETPPDVPALRARAAIFSVQGSIDGYATLMDNLVRPQGSRR